MKKLILHAHQNCIQNPVKRIRWNFLQKLLVMNYYGKVLHLRCLREFWLRLSGLNKKCSYPYTVALVMMSQIWELIISRLMGKFSYLKRKT